MLLDKKTYFIYILVVIVVFLCGCGSSKKSKTYSVRGQVIDRYGIEGVTINFSGGYKSVITDKNGAWSKSGLQGKVTITPSKEGMQFDPPSLTVSAETNNIVFKLKKDYYAVSGTVQDQNGEGIEDVEISFLPIGLLAKTDSNGNWFRDGLFGDITIIPYKENYRFSPSSINIDISDASNNITFEGTYDDGIPSVPTGLSATITEDSTVNRTHAKLTWNANPEDDEIINYYVWYRPDEKNYFTLLKRVNGKTTSCIHEWVNKDKRYWYTVSAENARGNLSDRCTPISFVAGEAFPPPPAAPTWSPSPLKTGAYDEGPYSCWIELEWNEVYTRQDGSPLEDLLRYNVYTVDADGLRFFIAHVPAGNNTYRLDGLTRKAKYTFVVTAVDKWMNESDLSEERTIIAGGPIPKAPELLSVQAIENSKAKIVFSAVTENTEESGGGSATITEYVIYRALNAPLNFIEIGRIKAQYPQPESYSFTDNTTVRGDNYYYNVRAVDSDFIYSEYSNHMGIKIGDYTPPSTPTWVSIHTQINSDYSIDNILTFNCGQEPDLHGINVYTRLASTAENWTLIGVVQRQEENPYTFVHRNLSNKETYQYRLVAFDLVGNSSSSSEVGSVVAGNLYPPKAPVVTGEGFYSYELNQACVRLTWPEVTENDNPSGSEPVVGLAGYRIYRSHEENYNYKLVTTVSNNGEKVFVDQGLYNGISYYYRVTAYNVFGQESEYCQVEVVAGDPTPPLRPEVTMTPIFNPASPSLVTVELRITSEDNPSHYKIYRSTNGVTWFLENTIPRAEGITTYSYEMAYGNTAFCRVAAISIPGVEGPYFELNQRVLDTVAPHDIPAPAVTFSQTADGDFISAISWSYTPPEDFARYEILSEQYNPATVATITNKDDNAYYINGLQAGVEYSFAVVCVDVYGLRSNPNWTSATPVDTTIPKAPGSVTATGGIRCVWIEWEPVTKNTNGTVCNDLGYYIIEIANNEESQTQFLLQSQVVPRLIRLTLVILVRPGFSALKRKTGITMYQSGR